MVSRASPVAAHTRKSFHRDAVSFFQTAALYALCSGEVTTTKKSENLQLVGFRHSSTNPQEQFKMNFPAGRFVLRIPSASSWLRPPISIPSINKQLEKGFAPVGFLELKAAAR